MNGTGGTHIDLTNARLLIPAIQEEPLPIAAVKGSPCTQACPAGINVKAYVSLIAEGRHAQALEVIRRRCPLPAICGRICHHPCEKACKRARYDEAVAIRALKRFVADRERDVPDAAPPPLLHTERIAIIGSGPAGLTAGYDLRLAGYPVTVFEADPEPGGMMRYGIADYRLPAGVLDAEIEVLRRSGVDILTGTRIGRDLTFADLGSRGYAAMVLAVGAQHGRRLGLKDELETPEIQDALSFLRHVKSGERVPMKGKVLVIGGGSTAVEAARTALRLGAQSVEIVYRRYREELLADDEEIRAAEAEGVRFRFLVAPRKIVRKKNMFQGLELVEVGLGAPDASGRRRPIEIPGSEFFVAAQHVLAAVGQEADFGFLPPERVHQLTSNGRVVIDEATAMTQMHAIFAAGDLVSGPATVIDAIAGGHRAAESIRHLLEEGAPAIREQKPERRAAIEYELPDPEPLAARRIHAELLLPSGDQTFDEVELAFTPEEAMAEARRCLRCGPCGECRVCATTCSRRHIMVRTASSDRGHDAFLLRTPSSVALALNSERPEAARLIRPPRAGAEGLDLAAEILPVRSRIVGGKCRACSRCVDVCPFHALSIPKDDDTVRLNLALCRGCGLCSAVCPTGTAKQSALSPEWWADRLDAILEDAESPLSKALRTPAGSQPAAAPEQAGDAQESILVLACQRRAGALEQSFDARGYRVEVIRFRCVGQTDAGALLELARRPFARILVAGCVEGRCRFANGARRAAEQVTRAHSITTWLGLDPSRIVADWSPDRAGDLLELAVARLIHEHRASAAGGGH